MKKPSSNYSNRNEYRKAIASDLCCWHTEHQETELFICAEKACEKEAYDAVVFLRTLLDEHIKNHPQFLKSYAPLDIPPGTPETIACMYDAAAAANVGPMAAVAGAFAAYAGSILLQHSPQVIIENGGDIFMKTAQPKTIAVYAGQSPLSMKIGVTADSHQKPIAVCTSSGSVGHSKSFGNADAAVVLSRDACLADACATRLGNDIACAADIQPALESIHQIPGIIGAIAVLGNHCGAVGDIQLVNL